MPNRFAHIQRLVTLRETLRRFPDEIDYQMKQAIVGSLPEQYRKVYDWVGSCYYPVTSGAVAKSWGLKPNHASTLLNELWQFGLLTRTEIRDEHGRVYQYTQTTL